ncbi:TRAP transporter small permease [Sedimentitalea sp. XS_ASV28]|uniref:TRAP transporter small permease n=1 Tax=Sedimentitalea sp. XS_ASV28 TaxID=3241296 RepID=UPI003516E0BD
MIRVFDEISVWLSRMTRLLVMGMTAVLIGALVVQVFSRYVLGSAFSWTEELAITLFCWVILLEAASAIRDKAHVCVDALLRIFPEAIRGAIERLIAMAILTFCVFTFWSGCLYVSDTAGQVSPALQLPVWLVYLSVPVFGFVGAVHALLRVLLPLDHTSEVVL